MSKDKSNVCLPENKISVVLLSCYDAIKLVVSKENKDKWNKPGTNHSRNAE